MNIKGIELDSFTVAYIEAMLWATNDESDKRGGVPMDSNYNIHDIELGSLKEIKADCEKFQNENEIPDYKDSRYSDLEKAGHDFFLTRREHGVGFWDRDELTEDQQKNLTAAACAFDEVYPYVGDDGQIYHN